MKCLIYTLLLIPGLALGQQDFPRDLTVSWDNPSEYVDGSVIEAGDLETIRVEVYRQNDTVPAFVANVPDNGEGQRQREVFPGAIPQPGTYTVVAIAVVIGGVESDPSDPDFVKHVGKPRPPATLTVE